MTTIRGKRRSSYLAAQSLLPQHLSGRRIEHSNSFILTTRGDGVPVGTEGYNVHRVVVFDAAYLLAGCNIVNPGAVVIASGRELLSIGTECDRIHDAVLLNLKNLLAPRCLEHSRALVVASGGE